MSPDYSGQNLRGHSFKGCKDLTGANFSYADIQSADFTNAILRGANFTGAKAGLQQRWVIGLLIFNLRVVTFSPSMLKLKVLLFMALTGGILLLNFPSVAQTPPINTSVSSRVLREARIRKKINWGLRTASPPVSFQDNFGRWQGFCTDLIDLLENYLKEKPLVSQDFIIERYGISLKDRFVYTRSDKPNPKLRLDGECGSDTTKQERDGIKFSLPFYRTRILLLIRKDKRDNFSFLNKNFIDYNAPKPKIGAITSSLIPQRVERYFGKFEVEIVKVGDSNTSALNSLLKGKVDALASSEIFLAQILKDVNEKTFKENNFYVNSKWVISRETYGLILPGDDEEWVNVINQFLIDKQSHIQDLIKKHITTNQNILNSPDTEIPGEKTSDEEWMFILLIILGIVTVFGLTCAYWVKRRNRLSQTKPSLDTLDLYHNQGVDPRAIAISFKQLAEKHPDADLQILGMGVRGEDKFLLRAKTAPDADKSELSAEYFETYNHIKTLPEREVKLLLAEKDSRISSLENFVTQALQSPKFYTETYNNRGDTMSQSPKQQFNNDLRNAQIAGGFVNADTVSAHQIGGNINNYTPQQRQNLTEAASEIQQLLQQLEQTNPTTTTSEKMTVVAKAVDEIEKNPTLKARVIGALKCGGKEALKEAVDHPLVNILMASIEGWQEA